MICQDFIYVHINRTGGTSTTAFMKQNKGTLPPAPPWDWSAAPFHHADHWKSEEIKNVIGAEEYFKKFRFTIVRNPWDRMVSQHVGTQRKALRREGPIDRDEFNKYTLMSLSDPSTWDAVMHKRLRTGCRKGCAPGTHLRGVEPCSSWVTLSEMDFVARTESLERDLYCVLDKIEAFSGRKLIRPPFPHLAGGGSDRERDYRVYYSEETRRRVAEHFASDIANFGYRF